MWLKVMEGMVCVELNGCVCCWQIHPSVVHMLRFIFLSHTKILRLWHRRRSQLRNAEDKSIKHLCAKCIQYGYSYCMEDFLKHVFNKCEEIC